MFLSGTENGIVGHESFLRGDSFRLALREFFLVYLSTSCTELFVLKYYHYNCVCFLKRMYKIILF